MQTSVATTPFGRRPMTLGQLSTRIKLKDTIEAAQQPGSNAPAAVNKWALFRTLTEIRHRIGVSDRAIGVLNALLSFHPETALSLPAPSSETCDTTCELVVFPSNRALMLRANGMSEATLRRHLATLVGAGLILRRDSPNGKRYARRSEQPGAGFGDAFGFDLTPLVARAGEFEALAEAERGMRRRMSRLRERISLQRRDIAKMIALGVDEAIAGPWDRYRATFLALARPLPRACPEDSLTRCDAALASLAAEIAKTLQDHHDLTKTSGNVDQTERHQSNSNTQWSNNFEPASEKGRGEAGATDPAKASSGDEDVPLGMVLEACPDVKGLHFGAEPLTRWSGFIETARTIRPMLGISPDAWGEAVTVLGERSAAIVVATILQRSEHSSEATTGETGTTVNGSPAIRSPGGYLRALTEQARAGTFVIGPVLMALIGQRQKRRCGRG